MKLKEFSNSESIYAEHIEGSDKWFYCQIPNGVYPDDLLETGYKFDGTCLMMINIQGEIYEPVKREENVFVSEPFYNIDEDKFLVITIDFNKQVIELIKFSTSQNDAEVIFDMALKNGGDLINLIVIRNSDIFGKYEGENFKMFYPKNMLVFLEKNESIYAVNDDKFICSKWIEDPEYREEIIIRNISDGEITDRKPGYSEIMPNGELWIMTK